MNAVTFACPELNRTVKQSGIGIIQFRNGRYTTTNQRRVAFLEGEGYEVVDLEQIIAANNERVAAEQAAAEAAAALPATADPDAPNGDDGDDDDGEDADE